jgi:hypothetical protein
MAIASLYPTIKPSLNLDFANTKLLDSRITFTRSTTATYYDGVTTAKAEENLLLQSQDFTTSWSVTGTNATVTANTTAAPDGTTTADTLTDDATNGTHRVGQSLTTSNTNQLVYSVFAKYSTLQWITLALSTSPGAWAGAKFDVQNGVLGSTSQQGTGFTANSSSITSVGNGWYRCVLVLTPGASGSAVVTISGATDGTTFTTSQRGSEVYTGTGSSVFIWGAQLEERSSVTSYTATTTQPITNYIPVLRTAAAGVARFDHNPTTFESLGLLIEEQRTNLVTYSEQFDNAAWTKINASITANAATAPDGTITADKEIPANGVAGTYIAQGFSATSGTTYTYTVYAKAAEFSELRLLGEAGAFGSNTTGVYNLSTGVASVAAGSPTVSMTSVGNGWWRCVWTATATATTTGVVQQRINTTGDGYSGIFIWGAQLEAGAFPTSYIPTVAATVTRNADAASMTGTNFTSWFNAGEGTFYADFNASPGGATGLWRVFSLNSSNRPQMFNNSGSYSWEVSANGSSAGPAPVANAPTKFAGVYKTNDVIGYWNGTAGIADTSVTLDVVTAITIGSANATANRELNNCIKKLAYYPLRLTNANLQALTT